MIGGNHPAAHLDRRRRHEERVARGIATTAEKQKMQRYEHPECLIKPLRILSETDQMAAKLVASGWKRSKVRAFLHISDYHQGRQYRTKEWRDLLRFERQEFVGMLRKEMAENAPRARVKRSVEKAADRLDLVLDREGDGTDGNAIKAADIVLKHALPKELGGDGGSGSVVINVTGQKESDLSAIEAQILKEGSEDGEVIEGEVGEGTAGRVEIEGSAVGGDAAESDVPFEDRPPRF